MIRSNTNIPVQGIPVYTVCQLSMDQEQIEMAALS